MGLCGWEAKEKKMLFAQDTSLSGRIAQQWKLRVTAEEAELEEVARSRCVGYWQILSALTARMSRWGIQRFPTKRSIAKGRPVSAARKDFWELVRREMQLNFRVKPSRLRVTAKDRRWGGGNRRGRMKSCFGHDGLLGGRSARRSGNVR